MQLLKEMVMYKDKSPSQNIKKCIVIYYNLKPLSWLTNNKLAFSSPKSGTQLFNSIPEYTYICCHIIAILHPSKYYDSFYADVRIK